MIAWSVLPAIFRSLASSLFVLSVALGSVQGDEVREAVEDYLGEVSTGEILSVEDSLVWFDRLSALAQKNPSSRYYNAAIGQAVGISNSMRQFERSESLILQAIGTVDSVDSRVRWLRELGEIRRLGGDDASDCKDVATARTQWKKAVEAYREAADEVNEMPDAEQSVSLSESKIYCLAKASELLSRYSPESRESDQMMAEAEKTLAERDLTSGPLGVTELGYTRAHFSETRFFASLVAGDFAAAREMLTKLSGGMELSQPLSYFALKYAEAAFRGEAEKEIRFLIEWEQSNAHDNWTCVLLLRAAGLAYDTSDFETLRSVLDQLEEIVPELYLVDSDTLRHEKDGYLARYFFLRALSLAKSHEFEGAASTLAEFEKVLPQDSQLPVAKNLVAYERHAYEQKNQITPKGNGRFRGWFGTLNLIALLVVVILLAIRRARSRKAR